MKTRPLLALCLFAAANAPAAVLYVDVNSASPTPPYASWSSAAATIQDAVDAAVAGDQILVTNGVYQTGGRPGSGRVVVDKAVAVQSVNGPQFTIIDGGGTVRCVSLTDATSLIGFTITNGFAGSSDVGGGVGFDTQPLTSGAVVSRCVIVGNSAGTGGGAAGLKSMGGPAFLFVGTLEHCTLSSNAAIHPFMPGPQPDGSGGGAINCKLHCCTLIGNSAVRDGGGAASCILDNCLLRDNSSAFAAGGGAAYSDLNNCTLVRNTAPGPGGAFSCWLKNCLLYDNISPGGAANYAASYSMDYCCTTPAPEMGLGHITNAPIFVAPATGNFRLRPNSPCVNAGHNDYVASPVDLEGKERIVGGTVDMGAYEWVVAPTHYVSLNGPNPTPPYLSWSTAATNIQDAVDYAGYFHRVLVTNGVYQSGGRAVGAYGWPSRVVVRNGVSIESINGPQFTVIQGGAAFSAMRCVYMWSSSRLSGFTLTNGSTYRGIFFADPGASEGGGVYCASYTVVSNCVLTGNSGGRGGGAYGGTLVNCTLTGNSADEGGGAAESTLRNCILATNSVGPNGYGGGGTLWGSLSDCTLIGNSAPLGGGTRGGYLINCRLIGNAATDWFGYGGGAYQAYLVNCILTGNVADYGGGARDSTLVNCSVFGNGVQNRSTGGGVYGGTHRNTSIIFNAGFYANYYEGSFEYCCTWPLPPGQGNIGDSSACIDAGNNDFATTATDFNGRPRIVNRRVDIGAAEFQGPFDDWLRQYGLATDGSADFLDLDGDGFSNYQESIAGTNPTNASSALRLLGPTHSGSGLTVSWQSVSDRTYFLERATNLGMAKPFSLVASELTGQAGVTSYTDASASGPGPYFYRVAVQTEQRPFLYATNDGAIFITGYTGSGGAEVIPATLHGLPVTSIASYAFYNKYSLTSVTIPEGVTNIGAAAFLNCYSLNDVTIPNSVTSIGNQAFAGTRVTAVTIPAGVSSIEDALFSSCYSLASVTIPHTVTNIGYSAFSSCSSLTNIVVPDSVVTLGAFAFLSCTSLASVTIGHSVTSIPYGAFSNCISLVSVAIPDSVTDLGEFAFSGCTKLMSATVGNHVGRIGSYAFYWCSSLAGMTIPDNVTSIADWAFFNCPSLTNVTVGNGVTSIGEYAFENCTGLATATLGSSLATIGANAFNFSGLKSITIPSGVTNIGAGAFYSCSSLTAIEVDPLNPSYSSIDGVLLDQSGATLLQCPGGKAGDFSVPLGVTSIEPGSFGLCTSLTRVTIPNAVTNIGAWSFYYCASMTNIFIGSGVQTIGDGAFYYSYSLAGAYFLGNAPTLGGPNVFMQVLGFPLNNTVYYVPGTTGWAPTFGGRPTAPWTPPNH
jgi:hypothetical protein